MTAKGKFALAVGTAFLRCRTVFGSLKAPLGLSLAESAEISLLAKQAEMFGNLRYARKNAPVSRIFLFGRGPAHRAGLGPARPISRGLVCPCRIVQQERNVCKGSASAVNGTLANILFPAVCFAFVNSSPAPVR